jgi:hypothetical protein
MNVKLLSLACIVVVFASCKSRQYAKNNRKIEKTATKETPNFKSYTTLSYIDTFKGPAIEQMNLYGIPASIILAQGILESGSGNSSLAKFANNHFGIKCTSDWKGKAYYKDDDNQNDCFRVYNDARESYKDHSNFLKRKRYSFLFELDKNDYKNWAEGLKQAGYATNPKYPQLLIGLIDKYQLYQYDQPESEREKLDREDRVFTEINANIPLENKKFVPVAKAVNDQVGVSVKPVPAKETTTTYPTAVKAAGPAITLSVGNDGLYLVKKGDTLFNISKRSGLSVEELKTLNKLNEDGIKIGQKLKVGR